MKASIINIGDELLIGQVTNTNAAQMAQQLVAVGIDVANVCVCGDNAEDITRSLQLALQTSQAVLITGGLGPTKDDITKQVLCRMFNSELYESPVALATIKRIFAARGYELTPINRQQALVPRCCTVLDNTLGTAPGMWFEVPPPSSTPRTPFSTQIVVSMPGVPFEMRNLMHTEVVPRLCQHFATGAIVNKNILVQGIGESFLSDLIEPWELALPSTMRLAYLPQAGMVKLRLTAHGAQGQEAQLRLQVAEAVERLYPLAGQYIVGEDFETLPELVADRMCAKGLTLSTAESCTGGAIASSLTALAGASTYFKGGVVAYSNEVKESALGVKHETLVQHGAVSEETVREMAESVRKRLGSDYSIATTGIAGPTGGTAEKPVGTVWIAVSGPNGTRTQLMHYGDRRQQTIDRTTNQAYAMLLRDMRESN